MWAAIHSTTLKFAREMRNFYAAHVREPMFPAMTRDRVDVHKRCRMWASASRQSHLACLTLVATYALGALVASPMAGLAAAAMLGIDHSAVYWAIGGWRDELFAFFAISCAWAWLRFSRHADARECRPRRRAQWRRMPDENHDDRTHRPGCRVAARSTRGASIRRELSIAVGVMAVLVAPFLINCAIATGDPFYAINNHTDFYLKREAAADLSRRSGTAAEVEVSPISAVGYSLDKFESRPIAATDNAVRGVFVYPFTQQMGWAG